MNNHLTIHEKYSQYWPAVAAASLILAVILFGAFQLTENVLWSGYLRLASFIFFAIGLLSLFKIKDGQVEITVTVNDGFIESRYKVRDKIIFSNSIPLSDFYKLKIDSLPDKSLYNDFMKSDKCVRFRREDESAWYYFNEIESRVIPLSSENAERLYYFLKESSAIRRT